MAGQVTPPSHLQAQFNSSSSGGSVVPGQLSVNVDRGLGPDRRFPHRKWQRVADGQYVAEDVAALAVHGAGAYVSSPMRASMESNKPASCRTVKSW